MKISRIIIKKWDEDGANSFISSSSQCLCLSSPWTSSSSVWHRALLCAGWSLLRGSGPTLSPIWTSVRSSSSGCSQLHHNLFLSSPLLPAEQRTTRDNDLIVVYVGLLSWLFAVESRNNVLDDFETLFQFLLHSVDRGIHDTLSNVIQSINFLNVFLFLFFKV